MSVRFWFSAICVLLWATAANAQTATLLRDINTTVDASFSSQPQGLVDLNGVGYFFASSGPNARGLWRTDGTAAGTWQITGHLDGRDLTPSGGKLFFVGNDGIHGSELWTSDGTTAGTAMVKDIGDGFVDAVSSNFGLLAVDGTVFFVSGEFGPSMTLWKSDGTDAGSIPLLTVDRLLPSPLGLLDGADGVAYFYANDGVNGSELWKSDGTPAGTVLVRDIRPGPESSFARRIGMNDGSFIFSADDGIHGRELWKSDGTMLGTSLVVDLTPGAAGTWPDQFFSSLIAHNWLLRRRQRRRQRDWPLEKRRHGSWNRTYPHRC